MKRTRMEPAERRKLVLDAALDLAESGNYLTMTRNEVGEAAGISGSHIHHLFGSTGGLRNAVLAEAIERDRLAVVAQGIIAKDPIATTAAIGLRKRALNYLLTSM